MTIPRVPNQQNIVERSHSTENPGRSSSQFDFYNKDLLIALARGSANTIASEADQEVQPADRIGGELASSLRLIAIDIKSGLKQWSTDLPRSERLPHDSSYPVTDIAISESDRMVAVKGKNSIVLFDAIFGLLLGRISLQSEDLLLDRINFGFTRDDAVCSQPCLEISSGYYSPFATIDKSIASGDVWSEIERHTGISPIDGRTPATLTK